LQLKGAHAHWRYFGTYFRTLQDIALLGAEERGLFISRQTISRLIDFYLWEDSPRAKTRAQPRKKIKMGDKFSLPNMSDMTKTLALLVRSCLPPQERADIPPPPSLLAPGIPMQRPDHEMLTCAVCISSNHPFVIFIIYLFYLFAI